MKQGDVVECKACDGKGRKYDHMFGVFTLGMGYLAQAGDNFLKEKCYQCKGTGFIEVKTK